MAVPRTTSAGRRQTSWENWSGTVRGVPERLEIVHGEDEICEIVRDRGNRAQGIGVAGAGHSYAGLVSPAGRTLLDLIRHKGIVSIDRARMTVTVKAGTSLRALNRHLAAEGLALPNQSAIDEQTVAGAVATATHGSGPAMGTLSSHLRSVRLVAADGAVRTVTDDEPEFDAVRVHLGCLGVVTALTLDVVPAHTLRKTIARTPLKKILGGLDELRKARYGGFWWYPHTSQAVVWRADPTGEAAPPVPSGSRGLPQAFTNNRLSPAAARPVHSLAARIEGRARSGVLRCDEALLGSVPSRLQGFEYGIPVARAAEAITELADTVTRRGLRINAPVDVRFTGADSAWLSPSYQRDTCYLGVTCALPARRMSDTWSQPFSVIDDLLARHEGRPHWAKVHFREPSDLAARYPRWRDFVELRRRWDPDGVFLGDYLRAAFQ
ncbi:D-arabinono-1,4-lactone oxidase [Amycolatopsis keratiniphila]|uniref:D-arabinono-1,4-lactone oxidase n=1 Tax=Amycolatopsis keratiniphila TaxID=129921 RepID=UPI0009DE39D8|nr:D-arabinono-1,4-lactone oxidase [Amycolatopsis keratiniphila]